MSSIEMEKNLFYLRGGLKVGTWGFIKVDLIIM